MSIICHPHQLFYGYSELSDIVQLDGPADNTESEEDERVALEENDFLGMINAEAIKALQEGEVSSDGTSGSSSSDSADELTNVEEEVGDWSMLLLCFCHSSSGSALPRHTLFSLGPFEFGR